MTADVAQFNLALAPISDLIAYSKFVHNTSTVTSDLE